MSNIVPWLPHLIAFCNLTTLILLIIGLRHVRQGQASAHKRCMLSAVGVAIVFLVCYLLYHATVGNVAFAGTGNSRWIYFSILISHVAMAAVIVPMVPMTLYRAWRGQLEHHRRLARKTLPVWIYVSLSGIAVYVMAFHLFPPQT